MQRDRGAVVGEFPVGRAERRHDFAATAAANLGDTTTVRRTGDKVPLAVLRRYEEWGSRGSGLWPWQRDGATAWVEYTGCHEGSQTGNIPGGNVRRRPSTVAERLSSTERFGTPVRCDGIDEADPPDGAGGMV